MEVYKPGQLGRETSVPVSNIALQMGSSTVVLVIGAGVSSASPTSLPLGQEIAHALKQKLSYTQMAECLESLPEDDLLVIADTAEAESPQALELIQKTILDSFDFKTAIPNYAHQYIAILMAEGVVKTMTTNWDTCVERAAGMTYSDIVSCRLPEEVGRTGTSAVLLKLHGCAEIENSIKVSSKQVGEPVWWASHQVSAAIENSWVVFVGIGSIVPYIRETIGKIVRLAKTSPRIRVVDIQRVSDWDRMLSSSGADFFIKSSAQEFLDDVITSLTNRQLLQALTLAQKLAHETPIDGIDVLAATEHVAGLLRECPAHFAWLWARRGVFPGACSPVVLDPNFVRCFLALALLHSISPLEEVRIVGNTVSICHKDFMVELLWAKAALTSSVLCNKKTESLLADKGNNTLPHGKRCVVIVHGSSGPLPSAVMPESVVDSPEVEDIIDGAQTLAAHWISLDSLVSVGSKDRLRDLVGAG